MNEMKDIENFDQHVLASSTTALVKLLGLQNTDDINVLIQNSWHKIKDIHRSMVFFCSIESSRERRNKFFHYGHEHPGQDPILDQLALEIDNIKIKAPEEFQCNGCFRYESAFASPWTSDYWDEERHRDILKDCMMWLCNGNPNGQDSILIILLSLILILDTTEISEQLKYRDHITMMQAHYADLLWRYLKFKHGSEASKLFHKALMFSSTLKEANDITKRRLPI